MFFSNCIKIRNFNNFSNHLKFAPANQVTKDVLTPEVNGVTLCKTNDGKNIEIMRSNYKDDISYYTAIMKAKGINQK